MIHFTRPLVRTLFRVAFSLLLVKSGYGQTTSSTQPSELQAFQQTQMALAQSFNAMMAQGGTPQQLAAWQQQNASALAAQQQLAQQMAAASAAQPQPLVQEIVIPGDATPEMEEFLTNRATLINNQAQLHNQNLTATSPTDETASFQQQNGALLQRQTQLAQVLAAQSTAQPLPVPPPLQIPPDATPQMAAFLTARDQLMREQIQLQNQYVTATPSVRDAAMQQWQQQNAAQLQQLQQLAQNLSSTPSH